jgi:hypothetical protein
MVAKIGHSAPAMAQASVQVQAGDWFLKYCGELMRQRKKIYLGLVGMETHDFWELAGTAQLPLFNVNVFPTTEKWFEFLLQKLGEVVTQNN